MAHWGYCSSGGPSAWQSSFPAARGLHQSPIDIKTAKAEYDANLAANPLKITYLPASCEKLFNNGHSIQVAVKGEGSVLQGGPLPHKYRLEQFHFHWGKTSAEGAEHLIDGKKYAAELHLVHWNTELYASFGEAAKSSTGLAVLGVFIEAGKTANPHLQKLIDLLPKITHADDSCPLDGGFNPASLLPEDKSKYWTYTGSLTTPPCFESVRFILFKDPLTVSEDQLKAFRLLKCFKKGQTPQGDDDMAGNFRPVCPLNDRKVIKSFK